MTETEYRAQELKTHFKRLDTRRLLGQHWKSDADGGIDPQTSIDRIDCLLNGTYGAGAMVHAQQIIKNCKPLAAGRELVILITLLDTVSINVRKITELWKAAGVDFDSINTAAAAEVEKFQKETA